MVRCSSVIAALATLGVAAGSVGHFGGTRHGENKLRGGHPFGHKAKCCDSMDCEYGYEVIQSASEVECTGDDCQRDQCCQKVCSSLTCENGFSPVTGYHTTACPDGICTKDVCCVKDRVLCSAGSCSEGYRLIGRPDETECTGGEWHASECCERMCSSKTCNPTRLKAKDIDVACGDDGWTEDLCCDKLPVFCNQGDCSAGKMLKADASERQCMSGKWEDSECCDKVCSSKSCDPLRYTNKLDSNKIVCGESWGEDLCCDEIPVYCSNGLCPDGKKSIANPGERQCMGGKWLESDCCETVCTSKACNPMKFTDKSDGGEIVCGNDGWTEELCCDKVRVYCSQGQCESGTRMIADPETTECLSGEFEDSTCCEDVCTTSLCLGKHWTPKNECEEIPCGETGCTKDHCCLKVPVMCSEGKCLTGTKMVDDADTTECTSGEFEHATCCDDVCTGRQCSPDRLLPKPHSEDIKCGKDGWTEDMCCDKVPVYCKEGRCKAGTKMIADAETTECMSGVFEASTCCEEVCTNSVCSSKRWTPKDACEEIPCGDTGCTPEHCCLKVPVMCSEGTCLTGTKMIDDPDTTECMSGEFEHATCCDDVCTGHQCPPADWVAKPHSEDIKCGKDGWTEDMCCDKRPVYCSEGYCSTGRKMKADPSERQCMKGVWDEDECCDRVCSGESCDPNLYTDKKNGPNIVCGDDGWTTDLCCDKIPVYCNKHECSTGFQHVSDATDRECMSGVWDASECCETVCTSDVCPDDRYLMIVSEDAIVCEGDKCRKDECCELAPVFCSQGDCDDGYRLIEGADDRQCMSGDWDASECCEKVCTNKQCPKLYSLVDDPTNTPCSGTKCSTADCCTKDPVYCSQGHCSKGYKMIENPDDRECAIGEWDATECCEKVCSSKTCPPETYTAKDNSAEIVCGEDGWTEDLCCDLIPVYCSQGSCSGGWRLMADAGERQCTNAVWDETECCEKVCTSQTCAPETLTPKAGSNDIVCGNDGWTEDLCCDKKPVYCKSFECKDGFTLKSGADVLKCKNGNCTDRKCCEKEPTCGDVSCPDDSMNIEDADRVVCENGAWAETQCCDKRCSSYTCPSNCHQKQGPYDIRCSHEGCSTDKCCDFDLDTAKLDASHHQGWDDYVADDI